MLARLAVDNSVLARLAVDNLWITLNKNPSGTLAVREPKGELEVITS